MPALAKRKLDVVPLWLKIWLINRYGLCKGKRNHAEFAIFKSYEKKIPTCTQIMTLYHGINKISVYTSKYIPHIYRIQWIDRDSPSPTMSSSCTNLCVCVCVRLSARVKLGCHNVLWITGLYVRDKERQCVCGSERQSMGMFSSHVSSTESFCFR